MIVVSSPGSTGFGTCMLYPAVSEIIRSRIRPYAVTATEGSLASRVSSLRTFRINE